MADLIKEKISNICKIQLSENFNSMNKDIILNDKELLKIIKDVLPIFKSFKDPNNFETAKNFDYCVYPSILKKQLKLEFSTDVDMIDCSELIKLSEYLNLKRHSTRESGNHKNRL